ncbi:MAG: hypothetical protein COB53_08405 [Elusimicrobia bacterium]|nr:MAG: hypothetical protein COB53_08405 [Elusimicrobiota bacterium]
MRAIPYIAFFFSGLGALMAETAFHRTLVVLIGNTTHAAAVTTAVVLGALSVGSRWGARVVGEQPREGLRLFAMVTLAAASFAAMSPLGFFALGGFYAVAAPKLGSGWFLDVMRVLFASICLFPPAFLWGAGFPLITRGAAGRDDGPRRRARSAGWLYTVNTWGAAAGAILSGYLFLPSLGVQLTLFWSAAVGVAAALAALFWDSLGPVLRGEPRRRWRPRETTAEIAKSDLGEVAGLGRFGWIAAGLAGFVFLAVEILSIRLVVLFFGNGVVVFPLAVAAVLLGTGFSAAIGSTWSSRAAPAPDRLGSVLSAALAGSAAAIIIIPFVLPLIASLDGAAAFAGRPFWTLAVLIVPSFMLGACVPFAIRLRTACGSRASQAAGELYAVNTAGGVVGAVAGSFWLPPVFGLQGGFCFLAAVCATGAAFGWKITRGKVRGWRWRACASFAVAALILSIWRPVGFSQLYLKRLAGPVPAKTLLHEDGRTSTVTVLELPGFRDLFLDGIEEASTRYFHVQAFKLLGVLPAALLEPAAPTPALMIAFGAGISAGAALHSGLISTLDVIDINPDIERISELFKDVNGDVTHHPNFRFTVDDGRHYLIRRKGTWSLIVADATHPLAYDSWALYTTEFYRLVRARLTEGGVFAQWLPTAEMPEDAFRLRVRTFQSVFPHASLWNVPGSGQSLLIATPKPLLIDKGALQSRLDRFLPAVDAAAYGIAKAEEYEKYFVAGEEGLRDYAGEGPVDTDDHPRFHRLAFARQRGPGLSFSSIQESLFGDEHRSAIAHALRRYHAYGDLAALAEAYAIAPNDGNARFHARGVAGTSYEEKFSERVEMLSQLNQAEESPGVFAERVRLSFEVGDTNSAIGVLDKALRLNPKDARFGRLAEMVQAERRNQDEKTRSRLFSILLPYTENFIALESRGFAQFAVGDFGAARESLHKVLEIYPESTTALVNLADLDARDGDLKKAEVNLRRALKVNPFCAPALRRLVQMFSAKKQFAQASVMQVRIPKNSDRPSYYPCGEFCRPWTESWAAGGRL